MSFRCDSCEKYHGNCGNHFIDWDGHIRRDIPSESMYDNVVGDIPSCFIASKDYLKKQREKMFIPLSVIDAIKAEIEPYVYENKYAECIKEDMTGWICVSEVLKIIDRKVKEQTS